MPKALFADQNSSVTWDPNYFLSPNTELRFQADITPDMDSDNAIGQEAFTSELLTAGMGSYVWTVGVNLLNGDGDNTTPATLFLSPLNATNNIDANRIMGPVVELVLRNSTNMTTRALAIALPIVFGILILSILGGFIWYRRRHPNSKLCSLFTIQRKGYVERKSRIQRLPPDAKIMSNESSVELRQSGVGGGRNVFREELRRQEQMA